MSDANESAKPDGMGLDPNTPPASEADERRQLVARIASSTSFRKSPRLRQFLLFVAECSLTGHPEEITEYEIGWKVFERRSDYNPSDDSIVRTAARQLRTKVKEYFDSEGSNESWILEIPKGGYSPVFTKRESESASVPLEIRVPVDSAAPALYDRRWQIATAVLAAIVVISLALCYQLWQRPQDSSPAAGPSIVSTLLRQAKQPTRVVVGDFGAAIMSVLSNRQFSVEEYANRSYAQSAMPEATNAPLRNIWSLLNNGQIVSLPDVVATGAILRVSGEERKTVLIQHARQIAARDLRSGDFILLSAPIASPWISLFEDKLNFHIRYRFKKDSSSPDSEFLNRQPLPGEKPLYAAGASVPQFGMTYGLIARVPNLTGTGKVLLLCGLRYTGLEAAGEYATDPKFAAELARLLHVNDVSQLPDFEVLLETYSLDGAPRDVKVVAFRRIGN